MNIPRLLIDNPLLLLLTVAAVGYPLGRLKIGGFSLGVAAVLFAGLGIGALHPDLKLPELVYQLGLVVFVYTIGLSSGRGFFASFRRKGLRDNVLVTTALILAAVLVAGAHHLLGLKPTLTAGLFAGSLTNTPALAGVLEYLNTYAAAGVPQTALDALLAEPVVAYSVTYPVGVIGTLFAIVIVQHWWKIDYAAEARPQPEAYAAIHRPISNRTIRITRVAATPATISQLIQKHKWDVVFGRRQHNGQLSLIDGQTRLVVGDLVTIVGAREELDRATACLGEKSDENLDFNRKELDYRRVFISNPKVAGRRLHDLKLSQHYGAVLTRVRRGDVEFVPHGDTVLELGDRVRILTQRRNLEAVSAFLGDSYRAVSEIDILAFSLGLALGLLLGFLPIPLPGGVTLRLGLAGGPLIVALLLGAQERTGPIVWCLPYSANMTLRQVGLILFLAGVGTRAGYAFVATLTQGSGIAIFVAGTLITLTTALTTLWLGRRLLNIPMGLLIGMIAGLQTQPAVLGFALEQTGNELPNVGYAAVYPIATLVKIALAQALLAIFL